MSALQNIRPMTRAEMAQLSFMDIVAFAKVMSTRSTQTVPSYAHRVHLSCRRTTSPKMLSTVDLSMNCLIRPSSSDRDTPKNTPSIHPTSSRTRSRVHKKTATMNFSLTNLSLDSAIRKIWPAFAEQKAGMTILPHLSEAIEQEEPPKGSAKQVRVTGPIQRCSPTRDPLRLLPSRGNNSVRSPSSTQSMFVL